MAYSYLRVSSAKQAAEDRSGLDRQGDAFIPFCQRHGLVPQLDPLVDRGISAYSGRNRRSGALAAFLAAARNGTIPPGSVLVIEDLDRFSRESPTNALRTLLNEVFASELALGVVRFDDVLTEAKFNANNGLAIQLQVAIQMAHDYSRKLSERISASHERKRRIERTGKVATPAWRPPWLDWDQTNATFVANGKLATYQRIIELCLQGYGQTRVAQIINSEGHRNTRGEPWLGAAVSRVFHDRRMIGERSIREPDGTTTIVRGFFPAAVTVADFNRVQELTQHRCSHKGRIGRGDHRRFILQGVAFCPCGARLMTQCLNTAGKTYRYIICAGKQYQRLDPSGCKAPNMPYDEEWILRGLMRQRWQQYFNRPEDNRQRREIERELLNAETLRAKNQQAQQNAEANLQTLLSSGALEPEDAALLLKLAKDARRQAEGTEAVVRGHRERLQQVMARPNGAEMQKAIRERVEAFMATDRHDPTERVRFNTWVNTLGIRVILTRYGDRVEMSVEPLQKAIYDGAGGVTVAGLELVVQAPR